MKRVIAVSGFKRSGKDTLADYLLSNDESAYRVSFAGPLKDEVADKFNIPRDWLDNPEYKESPILSMPVDPQDKFSSTVINFMLPEFKVADTNQRDAQLYWTPRALAILVGSTSRAADPNHWVKQAIKEAEEAHYEMGYETVVISDLRYKSEVALLRKQFGDNLITIRVNRFDTSPSQDPSEVDLVGYEHDYVIDNKGTKEEFFTKIDYLLATLNKKGPQS